MTENYYKIRKKVLPNNTQIVVYAPYNKWPNLCSKTAWIHLCTSMSTPGCSVLYFPHHILSITNKLPSFPTDTTYCRPGGFVHLADFDRGHGNTPSGHQGQLKRIFSLLHPEKLAMASCSCLRALCLKVCPLNVPFVPGEDMAKKDVLCLVIFHIKSQIKSELFSASILYIIRRDHERSLKYKAEM